MDPFLKLANVPKRPPRFDLILAGVLILWAVLEALFVPGPGDTPERVAVALALTVPLIFRRQAPFVAIAVIFVVMTAVSLTANAAEEGTMPFPALLLATFSVALYARSRAFAIAGLVLAVVGISFAVSTDFYDGHLNATNIAIMTFFTSGAWSMGWAVRRRAEQARQALAESGDMARSAVAEERARIARELHDVIAHSVSIVAVQAGAAEELIESDPARAREHMGTVRRTAREALVEMRRLLDVLREDEASYAPQPGLARIDELVEGSRAAGVEVSVEELGEPHQLSPGVDLAAFRIVQEALTNVHKHAGSVPAQVTVAYEPEAVRLEVSNRLGERSANGAPLNGDSGGHGLIGMRERARLFGGSLEAGAEDGRFTVRATLPAEEPA